jgi:hypothetical protein
MDEPHPNYNEFITTILEEIGLNEKNTGDGVRVRIPKKKRKARFKIDLFFFFL